jgi:hypothetical protein
MQYEAKFSYDMSLLREALYGYWWRAVTGRLLLVVVVTFSSLVYLWLGGDRSWHIGAAGTVLVFGLGMIAAVYFVHSANMKRKLKDMGAPEATFSATESSFTVVSGAGSSTLPWSSVTNVLKLKRCWLLSFSKAQFITVPLVGVSEEMRMFILQRIVASGGKVND